MNQIMIGFSRLWTNLTENQVRDSN